MKKTSLLGTLALLGAGIAVSSPVEAQVKAMCNWIETLPGRSPAEAQSSIAELNRVLAKLRKTGTECVFGPGGEKFCEPCISIAAAKICDLAGVGLGPQCKEVLALT